MNPLRRLALLSLFLTVAASAEPPQIPWHSVPATAAAVARAQGKMVLIYNRAACDSCNAFGDKLFELAAGDEMFARTLDTFLPLRVVTSAQARHPLVASLEKRKAPSIAIVDASGVLLFLWEKVPGKWTPVGEELLRLRSQRDLIARAAELRLMGRTALADYGTGNALLDVSRWAAAAERLDLAAAGFAAAGQKENAQLARVSAAYARYGAGQKDRGRREILEIIEAPASPAVAAEAHLSYGGIFEALAKAPQAIVAETAAAGGARRGRRRTEDVGVGQRGAMVMAGEDRRSKGIAIEQYRKAYELAAPGSRTLELAKQGLARIDDRPLPAKDAVQAALRIVPPARQTLTGQAEFLVEAPAEVARIDFFLDEKKVDSATRAPFRATFDVGSTPRVRTVKAVAFDAAGTTRGEAMATINDRSDAFLVSIVAPAASRIETAADVDVAVRVPPGRTLTRVDVSWNDKPVASLTQPPFRTRVEAGGEFGYLRAVGVLDDGTSSEATRLYNSGAVSAEVNVGAVNVIATVSDSSGKRLRGLTTEDFMVEDGGERVAATLRSSEDEPVTVGIAIDSSSSMKGKQLYILRAASQLVERVLRSQDEAFVVAFDSTVRLAHRRSNDVASLQKAVFNLVPSGGTSMFDGVTFALQQFQGVAGKKALVVFSDGREGKSSANAKECERLARALGVPVYIVTPEGGERSGHALREIGEVTGGVLYHAVPIAGLPSLFDRLSDELRGQYVLSFTRPPTVVAGSWRSIRVSVAKRDANVRTIQGYRAN
ncbi:MAG TPA: VWA domain-containing protein [Thermoanaerobaculia bacterium]|nr:VWA domain-containing protein [Thermoanaerobaculia bacterium]